MTVHPTFMSMEGGSAASRPPEYTPADTFVELLLSHPTAKKVFEDFMWCYVGHPDTEKRRRGAFPRLERQRPDGVTVKYDRELFTGYSEAGDIVHVRAIAGEKNLPQGYFVAIGTLENGLQEPYIHTVTGVGGIEPRFTTLQLINKKARANCPPGFFEHRLPPDQWRLKWRTDNMGVIDPEVHYGYRQRHADLHPIEEVTGLMEELSQLHVPTSREMGRSALSLVDFEQ